MKYRQNITATSYKHSDPAALARYRLRNRRRASLQDGKIRIRFIKVLQPEKPFPGDPAYPHAEFVGMCHRWINYYEGGMFTLDELGSLINDEIDCFKNDSAAPEPYHGPERPQEWTPERLPNRCANCGYPCAGQLCTGCQRDMDERAANEEVESAEEWAASLTPPSPPWPA